MWPRAKWTGKDQINHQANEARCTSREERNKRLDETEQRTKPLWETGLSANAVINNLRRCVVSCVERRRGTENKSSDRRRTGGDLSTVWTDFDGLVGVPSIAEHTITMQDEYPIKQSYYPKNPAMQNIIKEPTENPTGRNARWALELQRTLPSRGPERCGLRFVQTSSVYFDFGFGLRMTKYMLNHISNGQIRIL